MVKKYRYEIIYCLMLLGIILNQRNDHVLLLVRLAFILGLSGMSFLLSLRFKMINTLVLSGCIYLISSRAYATDGYDISLWSIALAVLLYIALIMNIFLVIKDMYQKKNIAKDPHNGFKLLYIIGSFFLLIGIVVSSYAQIYQSIWRIDPEAFSVGKDGVFTSLYYSSVTYFTVGMGMSPPLVS